MISVIVPVKNEFDEIKTFVNHLNPYLDDRWELVMVNDGSVWGSNEFRPLKKEDFLTIDLPNVKIVNSPKSFGVGYSFDRGVEACSGDIIVITACDVFPADGWHDKVLKAVNGRPNALGSAVCIGNVTKTKHYGADLLFWVDGYDLPKTNPLYGSSDYTSLFKAKWLNSRQEEEVYDIPCVLGAFYFCTKEYYTYLGGWDTEIGNHFCGHRIWGSLEPFISLKSWLAGDGCYLDTTIEAEHIFGRHDRKNRWKKGGRGADWMWWNRLVILETMILDDFARQGLYDFVKPELNFNVARKWIKENKDTVLKYRELNRLKFKYDHRIFTEKFGYDFTI